MKAYITSSIYGYCLNDEKPPKIDSEAFYQIVDYSKYYKNCVIIERVDKKDFEGTKKWIVDLDSLSSINLLNQFANS